MDDLIIHWGAVAGAALSIGAVLVVIGRYAIVRPLENLIRDSVVNQLENNGGGSLKDAVDRIEANVQETSDQLAQHIKDHQETKWLATGNSPFTSSRYSPQSRRRG